MFVILLGAIMLTPQVSSQSSFSLEALAPEAKPANGREYISLSNGEITVELGYDCRVEDKLLFDLVFINESEHPILIHPPDFYYLNLDDPQGDSTRFPVRMALAPQKPYTWYDRGLEKKQGDEGLEVLLEIPLMFAEAFSDAFGADSYAASLAVEEERISSLKEAVRQEMIQEAKLAPGAHCSGFVYFPGSPETPYLLFCFPVDNHEFQFAYRVSGGR